jgi:formate hydrogenlyase subunit 3/multisubunit Na+/H+ antiporter MnhD subunit
MAGTALALLGALGVFGFEDTLSFLIAWEVMSFGGAVMILAEHLHARAPYPQTGSPCWQLLPGMWRCCI